MIPINYNNFVPTKVSAEIWKHGDIAKGLMGYTNNQTHCQLSRFSTRLYKLHLQVKFKRNAQMSVNNFTTQENCI